MAMDSARCAPICRPSSAGATHCRAPRPRAVRFDVARTERLSLSSALQKEEHAFTQDFRFGPSGLTSSATRQICQVAVRRAVMGTGCFSKARDGRSELSCIYCHTVSLVLTSSLRELLARSPGNVDWSGSSTRSINETSWLIGTRKLT